MAEEAEKLEMASSQQRVEPVAVAVAAAVVRVDVVAVVAAVVVGADVGAAAGVGVGVGAADCVGILPARTRGQRHHVQIHSLALCAR